MEQIKSPLLAASAVKHGLLSLHKGDSSSATVAASDFNTRNTAEQMGASETKKALALIRNSDSQKMVQALIELAHKNDLTEIELISADEVPVAKEARGSIEENFSLKSVQRLKKALESHMNAKHIINAELLADKPGSLQAQINKIMLVKAAA